LEQEHKSKFAPFVEIMSFRVCTYNIRFVLDRWDEREALLEETISKANADIYGFQEVLIGGKYVGQQISICHKLNQDDVKHFQHYDSPGARLYLDILPWWISFLFKTNLANLFYDLCAVFNIYYLSAIMGRYVQWIYHNAILKVIAFIGLGTAFVFGTTILVNKKKVDVNADDIIHETIRIGGWRGVQSVQMTIGGKQVLIVNVHLSSAKEDEDARCVEIKQVCDWIDSKVIDGGVIIMGDFNAQPEGPCYTYLREQGYVSAYKECHGSEPVLTFHQNHDCATKDVDDECTLDYIVFKGKSLKLAQRAKTRAQRSKTGVGDGVDGVVLIGTNSSGKDPTLYPSDHYGIVADFCVQ
jgi:endonuclease/exonuclease/phosphatase family metal-dependent hydrolase